METYLKDIFKVFNVPFVYISLIFLIYNVFLKFKPVTFITANEVERSLYAKESRLIYLTSRFIGNVILFGIFIFYISTLLGKMYYTNVIVLIFGLFLYLSFFYYLHLREKRKSLGRWGILVSLLYMFGWIIEFAYIISPLLNTPPSGDTRPFYFLIIIVVCFFSGLLQVLCRPVMFLLKFSKNKYVCFDDEIKKRWYVLYPLNNKEVLIGDSFIPDACTETKIIQREKLVEKLIKIIDVDELKKDNEETDLSKSNTYFLITFSDNEPIKLEVIFGTQEKLLLHSRIKNKRHAREVIAYYVSDKIREVPVYKEKDMKIIECCRKIRRSNQSEKWETWSYHDHLPKGDRRLDIYPSVTEKLGDKS